MRIQVVNGYLKLAQQDLVPVVLCGMDKEHTRPVARFSESDEIEIVCLACPWYMTVGMNLYSQMLDTLLMFNSEWDLVDTSDWNNYED